MSDSTPSSSKGGGTSPLAGLHQFDLAQIGLGAVVLIASLLPFYGYSFNGGDALNGLTGQDTGLSGIPDTSVSLTAWHGFFGWFGVLLAVGAAGALAASLFAKVAIPSLRLLVVALFGGALLMLLLALFVIPNGGVSVAGYSDGHSLGYWLALLSVIAATGLAYLRMQAQD